MPADASVWMLQIYKKSPRETSVFSSLCAAVEDIFRFLYNSLLAAPECVLAPLESALAVLEHALKMVGAIRSSRKGIQSVLSIQSIPIIPRILSISIVPRAPPTTALIQGISCRSSRGRQLSNHQVVPRLSP